MIQQLIDAGIEEKEAKKELEILFSEYGKENLRQIEKIVQERIKTRTPLQYLIGKAYFMDFVVKVNKHVLIPRPETEILVEETIKRLSCRSIWQYALDIGTGSGIIPIALSKRIPEIKIVAIDIKKEIINLARKNVKENHVEKNIVFKICDVFSSDFEKLLQTNKFNLIISNPPYVRRLIQQPEILHEPEIALFGSKENKSGIIYYERILQTVVHCPTVKLIALEIDPPLVNDLQKLLIKMSLNKYEIIKDYSKNDRCLFVYL